MRGWLYYAKDRYFWYERGKKMAHEASTPSFNHRHIQIPIVALSAVVLAY
jgi:hypothetical protein